MKTRTGLSVFFITAVLLLITSACRPSSDRIILVTTDNGWDSQRFHNAVAKLIIENAFEGYELRFSTASSTMNFGSMMNGDVDLDIETWADNIAIYPDALRNGDVVHIGVLVEDSRQGLYVPRYVIEGDPGRGIAPMAPTLRYVWDLARYPHVFPDDENPARGRIYGAIPGWMVDMILHRKYMYHGLNNSFNYMRLGSEAALFAALMSAYNLGIGWVGYCWEPSWVAGKLDIVLLEDLPYEQEAFQEGRTAFSTQELMITSSRQFPAKAPELMEFLKNYRTGSALVSETLAFLDETRATHDAAAIWFLKTHYRLIDEWLPPENAAKLRDFLSKF